MALWATQMAMAARGFGETLGREVTEDDLEPVNWVQVEYARGLSAVDYAAALGRGVRLPADACSSGGPTGGTCC